MKYFLGERVHDYRLRHGHPVHGLPDSNPDLPSQTQTKEPRRTSHVTQSCSFSYLWINRRTICHEFIHGFGNLMYIPFEPYLFYTLTLKVDNCTRLPTRTASQSFKISRRSKKTWLGTKSRLEKKQKKVRNMIGKQWKVRENSRLRDWQKSTLNLATSNLRSLR